MNLCGEILKMKLLSAAYRDDCVFLSVSYMARNAARVFESTPHRV